MAVKFRSISLENFNLLSEVEKNDKNTIFLVKDMINGFHSIFVRGRCYGERLNAEETLNRLDNLELEALREVVVGSMAELPLIGNENRLYVTRDDNRMYRYDADEMRYFCISAGEPDQIDGGKG